MSAHRVDSAFIQKVKDGVNLVEVVGQHVLLKKSGSNFVGLCPFHQERSPSFSVSETKQLFHCYGCKKGGDVLKFVMELHGSSFSDAIEELAERAKIALPKSFVSDENLSPGEQAALQARRERSQLQYKLNRFTAKFYHDHLNQDARTQEYLRRRGVDEEMQKLFYLGSTPPGWSPLSKKLLDAKAPLEIAKELGLIRDSKQPQNKSLNNGIPTFDMFRDRVMFPILDVRGKVVGFGGRALTKEVDGPKYLNSSESVLFQKSKTLYGLFQSQKAIRAEDSVIVVEGYFDFLALYRAGFQNVVATCGTALSADHLKTLKRFASKIILLFDSDGAGQQATLKSMELGLSLGMILFGGELPPKRDVDEVLFGAGPEANGTLKEAGLIHVQGLLKNAKALLDREIDLCVRSAALSVENKSVALKQIGEWLKLFQDPVGREIRIDAVCRELEVSRQVLDSLSQPATLGARNRAIGSASGNASGPAIRPSGSTFQEATFSGPTRGNFNPQPTLQSSMTSPQNASAKPAFIRPLGGPVLATAKPRAPALTVIEKTLLKGILQGGEFVDMVREAKEHLPEDFSLEELVQHSDIRLLFTRIFSGETPVADWESELKDPVIHTLFREGLLNAEKTGEKAQVDQVNLKDFQVVVRKALQKVWARFSQRMLADLTIEGDLTRSQEWLDVQNKIKELGNFYDQNE